MRSFFLTENNDVPLHCCAWDPEGQPVAIVQIIHGVAEHIARYAPLGEFLASHGFLVVGEDHPGHGETAPEGRLGCLDGGWMETVRGIHRLHESVGQAYPNTPYFMLGHSMGSFLLRTYLFTYHTDLAGALISGTGWQPAPILTMGLAMCAEEAMRLGEFSHSALLENLMFGAYNRKFAPNRTAHDWICSDEAVVDAYLADPLCGFPTSIQLCREMLRGLQMIQNRTNLGRMQKNLPVWFFAGQQDPVGSMGKGVERAFRAFREAGMTHVDLTLYPAMRHEALNEQGKEQVFADVLDWLHAHLPASSDI